LLEFSSGTVSSPGGAFIGNINESANSCAVARIWSLGTGTALSVRDDDLRVRPGRIGHSRGGQAKSFVGEVMQAARRAGHTGRGFGQRRSTGGGSRFGRGRAASVAHSLRSPSRRVVIKARIVRHAGAKFRSVPLARHIGYLEREGVTRDGAQAQAHMFDWTPRPLTSRLSRSDARMTGTISGSSSHQRTPASWPMFAPSPAS
jgi:hypothetical protein